jgi:Ca2+-binding EF-hand superfamily protein
VFDQIDKNQDGFIQLDDLHESFKKAYSNPHFEPKTSALLFERFDKNGDHALDLDEYGSLLESLNQHHKEFLETDFKHDANGLVNASELLKVFERKGYTFSVELLTSIVYQLTNKDNSTTGLKFDNFLYLVFRFDQLLTQYYKTNTSATSYSQLEKFIKNNF